MRKFLKISYMVPNREAQDSNITEYLPAVSCVAFNNDLKGAIHLLFLVSEKTFWVCWFVQIWFHKYQKLFKKKFSPLKIRFHRPSHKLLCICTFFQRVVKKVFFQNSWAPVKNYLYYLLFVEITWFVDLWPDFVYRRLFPDIWPEFLSLFHFVMK